MDWQWSLFLLRILAGVSAVPWPSDIPLCSEECAVTGTPKYKYITERTYLYSYFGHSHIFLEGVDGAVTQTLWKTEVELTWLSPCDMAITIKNPSIDESPGLSDTFSMERYPLTVAITDGIIQHVCSHPSEDTWSLNIKKGIASLLQNTLPTLSPISSGLNITETDVVGKCTTKYTVDNDGDKVLITKEKDHRLCQDRYVTQSEIPIAWLHAPLPVDKSQSICQQEIMHGIPMNISCQDENIIRPWYGSYKYIRAFQVATLEYQNDNKDPSESISNIIDRLVKRSLLYDNQTPNKDPSVIIQLEDTLKQICEKTLETVVHDSAQLVSRAIHYMRQAPDEAIEEMLKKIRRGHFCSAYKKLEELFLDAVGFVHESGAVNVIIDELLNGNVPPTRNILYISALHLTPRPSLAAVEALKTLFASSKTAPLTSLAAASMVNTYCRLNERCEQKAPVMEILESLGTKIMKDCASINNPEAQKAALGNLKALGNLGVINAHYSRALIRCMETGDADITVRVAAAQAFRNTKCHRETISTLSSIAADPNFSTQVRIASYLQAIRCASENDLKIMLRRITKERNTQVRGFILSHLRNIQSSAFHKKDNLRDILMNTVLPGNYSSDFRKFSTNIDLSYYFPSLQSGAGVETNIIYTPGYFVPSSLNFNLTTVVGGVLQNLGEFGIHLKGIDPVLSKLFGPEGYFRSSFEKIWQDFKKFITQKGIKIGEEINEMVRHRRDISFSAIHHLLEKLYGRATARDPQILTFIRYMGQEFYFSLLQQDGHDMDVDKLIEEFFNSFRAYIEDMKHTNINTAHTTNVDLYYVLPTIQGVPLKLTLTGTAVTGLKLTGKIDIFRMLFMSNSDTSLSINPSLSANLEAFVGYDSFLVKKGLKMISSIYNSEGISFKIRTKNGNKVEVNVDLPEKMEFLNIESEIYLMKHMRGDSEEKIIPKSVTDIRIQRHFCTQKLGPVFGLKLCYDMNVPNVFLSEGLPLGQKSFVKLSLDKVDRSLKGYYMEAQLENHYSHKSATIHLMTSEPSPPKEAHVTLSYFKRHNSCKLHVALQSNSISGGVWITLVNHVQEKSLEVFMKYRISQVEIMRRIKLDINTTGDFSEREIDINLFASSNAQFTPSSLVSEWKFIHRKRDNNISIDAIGETTNNLKNYIDFHYGVGVDLSLMPYSAIPMSVNIRLCEIYLSFKDWLLTSFLRKLGDDQYKYAVKVNKRDNQLLSLETSHIIEGSIGDSFAVKSVATATIPNNSYRAAVDLYYELVKVGISARITCTDNDMMILDFESFISRTHGTAHAKFMVDIPIYMNPIDFEASFKNQKDSSFVIQSTLKHGHHLLVEMKGPISFTATMDLLSFKASPSVTTQTTGPHKINMVVEFSGIKQCVSFDVKDQTRQEIALKYCVDAESPRETVYGIEMFIPTITDSEIYIIITDSHISMILENVMFPWTISPREFKGLADLSLENGTLKADLKWDGNRNPDNKFGADLVFNRNSRYPGRMAISGYITFIAEIFHVQLATIAEGNGESLQLRRGFTLDVTTPTRKTLTLQSNIKVEQQTTSCNLEAEFTYINFARQQYKFIGIYNLQELSSPYSYQVAAENVYTSPTGHAFSLQTLVKHQLTSAERVVFIKAKTTTHALNEPLAVEIALENESHSSKMDITMNEAKPSVLMLWDLQVFPQGGVRNINIELELESFLSLLKNVKKLVEIAVKTSNGGVTELIDSGEPGDTMVYSWQYFTQTADTYVLSLRSPARRMEGEFSLSTSNYSVTLYPNRVASDDKYEVSSQFKKSPDQHVEWQSHVSHPGLLRDMMMTLQYQSTENKIRGTLEIDIFPDIADKVRATLESSGISSDTLQVEAHLQARILTHEPVVTITTAYSPHVVGFDVMYRSSHSATPTFAMAAKYQKSSRENAALALILVNEGHVVLEISGTLQPENRLDCEGLTMTAVAVVPVIGEYDIQSKVCKAAFLQLALQPRQDNSKNYTVKVGLQEPTNFEFSLTEEDQKQSKLMNIVMLKSNLVSSSLLAFQWAYEQQEAGRVKNHLHAEMQKIMSSLEWWLLKIWVNLKQQAASKKIVFPPPKMVIVARETQKQLTATYKDLIHDGIRPRYEAFLHILTSPMMTNFKNAVKWSWGHVTRLKRELRNKLFTEIIAWQQQFQEATNALMKGTKELVNLLEKGVLPEEIPELLKKMEETIIIQEVLRRLDTLSKAYPDEYSGFQQSISRTNAALVNDLNKIRIKILNMSVTQEFIKWIVHNTNHWTQWEAQHVVDYIIESCTLFSIETEDESLQLKIPLHRPLYSLHQALKGAFPKHMIENILLTYYVYIPSPMNDLVWAYYNLIPHRIADLFPPFNRSAMIVGDTEILTFDGAWLRLPNSNCKVLLASYQLNELIVEYPLQVGPPQYTLTISGTTAVVRPDYTVTIDGHLVTKEHTTQGPITVIITPLKIQISGPLLTLRITQTARTASLEVSGWAFGHIAGLLGTYDGELGNDWMMPSGARANSLEQLVSSWQEVQECETPSIATITPPLSRVIRCNAMLNIRSRCNPVVNPELFIEMCYVGHSACDAARAYRNLCSEKGVLALVPMGC